jgi:hypothetical protein
MELKSCDVYGVTPDIGMSPRHAQRLLSLVEAPQEIKQMELKGWNATKAALILG